MSSGPLHKFCQICPLGPNGSDPGDHMFSIDLKKDKKNSSPKPRGPHLSDI